MASYNMRPLKKVHATQFAHMCMQRAHTAAAMSAAPGEIYDVLRMLAFSPVMGD